MAERRNMCGSASRTRLLRLKRMASDWCRRRTSRRRSNGSGSSSRSRLCLCSHFRREFALEFLHFRANDEQTIGLRRIAAVVILMVALGHVELGCGFELRDEIAVPDFLRRDLMHHLFGNPALLLRL